MLNNLSYITKDLCLGMVLTTLGWALLHQAVIKAIHPLDILTGQSDLGHPSIKAFFSDDSTPC